ncbi:MAG: beta-galactosidase, partial [Phocaeicola sp.]|nr:beta-galactosidase [Phocaeicola sp.]
MKTKRFLCAALGTVCSLALLQAQVRTEQLLEKGWKFTREDQAEFARSGYNDSKWQNVVVPHDWAIYGPFSINNDKQEMAITQDGQTEAMEHAGRTGGLPFVGTGWYRLHFDALGFEKGKTATLIFDGAMSHAHVYVNGQEAGYWPYGYNSFYVDVTPYMKPHETNELAVRLENEPESSRWYPGAGLYRNVHLVINEDVHIPTWGTVVTTPVVKDDYARINVKTDLVMPAGKHIGDYRIVTEILGPDGKRLSSDDRPGDKLDATFFNQNFVVYRPSLWSPENPALYTAVMK